MKAMVVRKRGAGMLPTGAMLFWSGTSANLPIGWSLVNMNAGVYIMGTIPANVSYTINGSDTHSHSVSDTAIAGGHTHSITATIAADGSRTLISKQQSDVDSVVEHDHPTTNSMTISGQHAHTVGETSVNSNVQLYRAFYVMKSNGAAIPVGAIAIWSGNKNTVPAGWRLCDGSTVDGVTVPTITNGFIRTPMNDSEVGDAGGTYYHTHTVPTNTGTAGTHTHWTTISVNNNISSSKVYGGSTNIAKAPHAHGNNVVETNSTGSHTHTVPAINPEGTLVPFIRLYFIIKVY